MKVVHVSTCHEVFKTTFSQFVAVENFDLFNFENIIRFSKNYRVRNILFLPSYGYISIIFFFYTIKLVCLWKIHARSTFGGTGWHQIPKIPNRFPEIWDLVWFFAFFAEKWHKNFSHKKLKRSKNVCLGELYIFCFINFFVSPSTKMWHPKNSDFWPFLQISRFFAIKLH